MDAVKGEVLYGFGYRNLQHIVKVIVSLSEQIHRTGLDG